MRRTVLYLALALPLAAADVKSIACVEIVPAQLPRQMAKSPAEYNCTVEFTGKSQHTTLYLIRQDGGMLAFDIDKGQKWAAVATGQSPAASAKLGPNGKTVTAITKGAR